MTEKNTESIATSNNQLNKLRAAVLGANDGIVSVAGLVLGVAGAASSRDAIIIAGVAGVVSGAISMAAGEFVSVSSQRDSEKSFLDKQRKRIGKNKEILGDELIAIYQDKGFSQQTAALAVQDLQKKGRLDIELEKESGIDPDDLTSPWAAAIASAISFVAGSLIPFVAIAFSPDDARIWITGGAVLISLILTGTLSARAGQANKTQAALRVVIWGIGAMAITYVIGHFIGVGIG